MRTWHNERGQAIVETALVLPIIMLIILGSVEMGRVSNAYLVVTHAARHGARHAAVGGTDDEIIGRVKNASAPLNPSLLTISILAEQGRSAGKDIKVSVSYPVQLITPLPAGLFKNPYIVNSVITMRIE